MKLLEKIESNAKKCRNSRDRNIIDDEKTSDKIETNKSTKTIDLLEKEKSPPIKRYYRHDLVDSQDDHSDDGNDEDRNIDSDEKTK